jgi:hypothetical protein
MNESEWLAAYDPTPMLQFLRASGKLSERKARLVAAGCCRLIWPLLTHPQSRRGVEVAELYAEQLVDGDYLAQACEDAAAVIVGSANAGAAAQDVNSPYFPSGFEDPADAASYAATWACWRDAEGRCDVGFVANAAGFASHGCGLRAQVDLLRDIVGPLPFCPLPPLPASLLRWNDGIIVRMANAIYDERDLPSGHLRSDRLAVLADGLQDAGCEDAELLGHLREGGVHVRGCFAVDLVLGKA